MILAAPWRRSVSSMLAPSSLVRTRLRRQLPTSTLYALRLPSCSMEYSKSKKKKKKDERAADDAEIVKPAEVGSPQSSEALATMNLVPTEPEEFDDGPALSTEQEAVVSLAVQGHNIFYTGSAGCGKSTVLKAIRDRLKSMGRVVHVLAPTGKVAIANGGMTTWSFAGWTPNTHKSSLSELRSSTKDFMLLSRLRNAETIIFDEISMVEAMHFDRLNHIMKAARSSSDKESPLPFGGTQIIVTGDFSQLPPVKPFSHCYQCGSDLKRNEQQDMYICPSIECGASYRDEDKWAFRSRAWDECNFKHVYLNTVHRQKSDPEFVRLLRRLRLGLQMKDSELELLTNSSPVTDCYPLKLYPTRNEVRKVNTTEFQRLKAPRQTYKCVDVFLWNEEEHPHLSAKGTRDPNGSLKELKEHSFEMELDLKQGMQVLLLHNIDVSLGLCNGAQGVVIGFEPFKNLPPDFLIYKENLPVYWPNYDINEQSIQDFMMKCRKAKGWPRVKFHNGIIRTIYPICQSVLYGDERPYTLLGRIQIPLAAAWALTIHKSQGMTLDRVDVSLTRAFEEGQIYVALSRVRTLAGLKVEGDLASLHRFRGNPEVLQWLKDKFGESIAVDDLEEEIL